MMFSPFNTCSMVLYLAIQYQGECGHIEGCAYSVVFVHNKLLCILDPQFNNSLTTKINMLNNRRIGLSYTKSNKGVACICLFSEIVLYYK